MERSNQYRRLASECLDSAREVISPHGRAVLTQLALMWSRLVERRIAAAGELPDEAIRADSTEMG